ncbi:MAG TPA: membrane protein insertase YidC [Verrucomicrobiae bacterium]|nr:membrane protein insertase YidC [Verrucomicrobiae bacterium]
MDRKTILILVGCLALLLVMTQMADKIFPPIPAPRSATNAVASATSTGTNAVAMVQAAPGAVTLTMTNAVVLSTNTAEQLLVITNDNARYTFTSRGGGLKLVELPHYPESVSRIRKKKEPILRVATLNQDSAIPTLAILGGDAIQGDDNFSLMEIPDGVRAEKVLPNGLRIVKEFQLTNNYLINATVWLENVSTQALQLPRQEWAVGTATPMNAQDNARKLTGGGTTSPYTVGTMWYDGSKTDDKSDLWFENRGFGCTKGPSRWEFDGGVTNVVWAAAHNQFFALIVMPDVPAQEVIVRKVNLPPPSMDEVTNDSRTILSPVGFETVLVYPAFVIPATQTVERHMTIYAGPKEYRTLARVGGQYNNNLDLVMAFGKISGIFSKALLLSMNGLHAALRLPYGWCIVLITVLIKVIFWPLTQASMRSMKRMQVLQPQMAAIRLKYKDDQAKMNTKVMEFMKENKMNPMSGCWPMLIQMPVFIGFFTMLRSAIELRGAPFLWIGDLSQPDTLFMIPGLTFIPFISTPDGLPFNPLPIVMGMVMLWQSHTAPQAPGVDPAQQKLMRYMPLMFLLFMYNYSSGLALYWTVQNLLTVLQTKLTKNMVLPAPPSPLTPQLKKSK